MSIEEISKTTTSSREETKKRHKRLLYAVNNPIRRKILKVLKRGCSTIEEIEDATNLSINEIKWHIDVLKHGYCVEEKMCADKKTYCLTKEGEIVDYLEE